MTNFKRKILNCEITQEYLAKIAGKTRMTIHTHVHNTENLKVKDLKKYADIINECIEKNKIPESKISWYELV